MDSTHCWFSTRFGILVGNYRNEEEIGYIILTYFSMYGRMTH